MHPSDMESTPNIQTRYSKPALRAALVPRLASFGIVVALCLVVSLFAALTHRLDGNAQALNPNGSGVWRTYHDPRGLFSVRLPKEWTASVETGTESFGDNTGNATETEEMIRFSDPALGEASARLYVSVAPIQSNFERHWYCQSFGQPNPPHDISAQTLSAGPFLFNTANAHFQVSAVIPGVLGPPHSSPVFTSPPPTPTPLPQQVVAADRTVLATILNSFQPANPTPLSCS